MTILKKKGISVDYEVARIEQREKNKERTVEVMEIRKAIVELFDSSDQPSSDSVGESFTSKQIHEYLVKKGFDIRFNQISPKMRMMNHVFYEDHGMWFRRICYICGRTLQLGDTYAERIVPVSGKPDDKGHSKCVEYVSSMRETLSQHIISKNEEIHGLNQEVESLKHEREVLATEVERLRSFFPKPCTDPKGPRRIEL